MLVRSLSDLRKKLPLFFALPFLVNMLSILCYEAKPNSFITDMINNRQEEFYIYIYIVMIITLFIGCIIVTAIMNDLDKRNFEVTTYKVFDDKIEFEEGFINHKCNVVMLKDIIEIHLNQNFIQKKFNVGTLVFETATTNSIPKNAFVKGLEFTDIENPQEIYNKVKSIHERG